MNSSTHSDTPTSDKINHRKHAAKKKNKFRITDDYVYDVQSTATRAKRGSNQTCKYGLNKVPIRIAFINKVQGLTSSEMRYLLHQVLTVWRFTEMLCALSALYKRFALGCVFNGACWRRAPCRSCSWWASKNTVCVTVFNDTCIVSPFYIMLRPAYGLDHMVCQLHPGCRKV
jgi:hypothetical protein